MVICSPLNEEELRNMMYTAQLPRKGPIVIRYPRGRGVMTNWKLPFSELEIGKGSRLREGKDLAIVTLGPLGNDAFKAAERLGEKSIGAAVYNMRFLKPIDESLLHEVFSSFGKVITVEDGTIIGGLGSALIEFAADHGYRAKITRMGVPDRFIEQGTLQELHRECGIDQDGIFDAAMTLSRH